VPYYVIRVSGRLSEDLLTAFPSLDATTQPVQTLLFGSLPDQAALTGVLDRLDGMGVEMLEVAQVPTPRAAGPDPGPRLGRGSGGTT
jgi:hypothetical protein